MYCRLLVHDLLRKIDRSGGVCLVAPKSGVLSPRLTALIKELSLYWYITGLLTHGKRSDQHLTTQFESTYQAEKDQRIRRKKKNSVQHKRRATVAEWSEEMSGGIICCKSNVDARVLSRNPKPNEKIFFNEPAGELPIILIRRRSLVILKKKRRSQTGKNYKSKTPVIHNVASSLILALIP